MGTHKDRRSQWCNRLLTKGQQILEVAGFVLWEKGKARREKEVTDSEAHTFGYGSRPRYGRGGGGYVHAGIRQDYARLQEPRRGGTARTVSGTSPDGGEPESCRARSTGTEPVRTSVLLDGEPGL